MNLGPDSLPPPCWACEILCRYAGAHAFLYTYAQLSLRCSRRFCQVMGGDITVTSEFGGGSTFTETLPDEVERA